ncbi:MAG: HEAT repeat domain-containing protein [Pyrinomonadaceae bacterium]|nr:HEAT repeat domain-containing protein [Pyrinomonadaceae bacterium]
MQEVLDYLAGTETLRRFRIAPSARQDDIVESSQRPGKQSELVRHSNGNNTAARRASRGGHSGASNMKTANQARSPIHTSLTYRIVLAFCALLFCLSVSEVAETLNLSQGDLAKRSLTTLQLEIERQRQRLSSSEVEERRDALMRLAALRHPDASRVAVSALNDAAAIVRATASGAVQWLPAEEGTAALLPLLGDKDEFIRQEAAYALGRTKSRNAVTPLIERLAKDKKDGVRGAAAVALGQIADEAAVVSLAQVLSPQTPLPGEKARKEKNVFVLRAAAVSLGQIASRAGLPALVAALEDERTTDDVRREAARALGLIGDPAAEPALRKVLMARDAYLSFAAHEALRRISRRRPVRPG